MKNILSLILAAVLLLLTTVPAFAIELSGDGSQSGVEVSDDVNITHQVGNSISTSGGSQSSTVTHTVQGGYVICIPGEVAFEKTKNSETLSHTFKLAVGEVRVPGTLHLSLSSDNYDGGWVLTSARGDTLSYSIKVDEVDVTNGGDLLSCANGTTYLEKELAFSLTDTDAKTASYTDNLTFNVYVD